MARRSRSLTPSPTRPSKLKNAKEKIQKKYAEDDPAAFGKGPLTSADKANKIYDAKAKDTNWGTWGASGTPGKKKFYTDGVISSNAYSTPSGHILGQNRRRVGAGFGRRRRFGEAAKKTTKADVKKAEKGHSLLKAMGKPTKSKSLSKSSAIVKAAASKKAAAKKAALKRYKAAQKAKAAAAAAKKLPKGATVAEKKFITPNQAKELKATGAGVNAQVDKTAHFEPSTDAKILGKKQTKALTNGDEEEEEVMSDSEVMELIQEFGWN